MKRVAVVLLLLICVAGFGFSQSSGGSPKGTVSFVLTDSFAFVGMGGELYLNNIGLGATFTAMALGGTNSLVFLYEPGAYGRLYLGDPSGSMFLTSGVTYFTGAGGSLDTGIDKADLGLLNVNAGIGYNAFFGTGDKTRFSFEIGPRYVVPVSADTGSSTGWIWVHFSIMFGMNIF